MSMSVNRGADSISMEPVAFVPPNLIEHFEEAFRRSVERRAFELYESAGRPEGRDWEHWFQAESEYLFARPKVLDSRDRYSLVAMVREKPPKIIQICMAPRRVIVRTCLIGSEQGEAPSLRVNEPPEQYLFAQWLEDVSPLTADATLDGNLLTLTAWKVKPAVPYSSMAAAAATNHSKT
jgi:hypothetical protein